MPKLTKRQIQWINDTAENPISEFDIEKALKKEEVRTQTLDELIGKTLNKDIRDEIAKAQEFSIKFKDKSVSETLWSLVSGKSLKKQKEMKWHAKGEDIGYFGYKTLPDLEVDTAHDLPKMKEIIEKDDKNKGGGPDTLTRLTQAFGKILEVQQKMVQQLDEDGNRLFSDEDIRRELWNPLVRDGTIPENIVPDRFSEQALAFKGAAEFYQKKIDKYTAKSTGKEGLIKGLKIAKDTASVVTTIVGQSVKIGSAKELAQINKELIQKNKEKAEAKDNSELTKSIGKKISELKARTRYFYLIL